MITDSHLTIFTAVWWRRRKHREQEREDDWN